MKRRTRAWAAATAAIALSLAACSDGSDDVAVADGSEAGGDSGVTDATDVTNPPSTDAPEAADEAEEPAEPDEAQDADDAPDTTPPASTTTTPPTTAAEPADEAAAVLQPLTRQFEPIPPGEYRVETLGAPFTFSIEDEWWVQPNNNGFVVLTDPASSGPGHLDIVFMRPSVLADPAEPNVPVEEQGDGWPADDIDGWLAAVMPGIVTAGPEPTTLGGLDAITFDVAIDDDFACGEDFCVGFATNRLVNSKFFDPGIGYRVWWIDGGDESPIAVVVGDGGIPDFIDHAEGLLATVEFEEVGPNPIPSEGDLWEEGFPTDVPAGEITLPISGGVTFELDAERFIAQAPGFAAILLDAPAEVDIFAPIETSDGEPIESIEDIADAVSAIGGAEFEVTGVRDIAGIEAIEATIASAGPPPGDGPLLRTSADDEAAGWRPPPEGTLWFIPAPDGPLVVTAEAYEPGFLDEATALADSVLATLSF